MRDGDLNWSDWDLLLDQPGDTFRFEVARTENRRREQPDRTFSREVMEQVSGAMLLWVGTRMERYWRRTNRPAVDLEVEVKVRVNGEPDQVFVIPTRVELIDGTLRLRARHSE